MYHLIMCAYKLVRKSTVALTERITELHDLSYHERLSELNLYTLEYLLLTCDLTRTRYYIVFKNLTPWAPSGNVTSTPPHSLYSAHHEFNNRKPFCRTITFENDFFNRCASAWNNLSSFVIKSKSVCCF